MKALVKLTVILISALSCQLAWAEATFEGTLGGGGGDSCEARIKTIADDIENWIQSGGAARLRLDGNTTLEMYSTEMLKALSTARVKCVGPGDKDYPVKVYGTEKECKNYVTKSGVLRIVCDRAKFYSSRPDPENDPVQYRLIHHEIASLAGLEVPNQDDSTYLLSNQITGFLEDQIVKRLAVKPSTTPGVACQDFSGTYTPKSGGKAPMQIVQDGCYKLDFVYTNSVRGTVRSFVADGVSRKVDVMHSGTIIYAQAYFSGSSFVQIYNYTRMNGESYIRRDTWTLNGTTLTFDQKYFNSTTGIPWAALGIGGEYERK